MQMNCFHCDNTLPVGDLFYCKACNEITCHRCLLKNHKDMSKHELEEVLQDCLPPLVGELMHEAKFFAAHNPTVQSLISEVENIRSQINSIDNITQQYMKAITKDHVSDLENGINKGTLTLQQFEKYKGLVKKNKDELQMAATKLDKETNPLTDSVSLLRDKLYDLDTNMRRAALLENTPGLGVQETILLNGGNRQSKYMDNVTALQHKTNDTFKCFPMPELALKTARQWHQSVVINGSVITMGGYNGQRLSSVECIDLRTHTKSDIPSMINARDRFVAGVIGNKVYVCGGYDGTTNHLNLCEYYDTEAQKWNKFQNLNKARNAHAGTIINGILYITGGYHSNEATLNSVESYDPAVNRWMNCPNLQQKRHLHGCAALEGQLYVCGGEAGGASCERFDKRDRKWSPCANMNRGGIQIALVPIDGKLYAIDRANNIEVYEPRNDKWTLFENVVETVMGMSAVVI